MAKKGLLKKIFGKNNKASKDENASTTAGAAHPKSSPDGHAVAEPIVLPDPQVGQSDSPTLDTESDHSNSGSLREAAGGKIGTGVDHDAPVTPESSGSPKSETDEPAANVEKVDAAGDATPTGGDSDVIAAEDEAVDNEKEEAQKALQKKKEKKKWAEERISQMYSSSASKPVEKPKIEVGHDLNAERRKWIEGLSSPKQEQPTSHVPDDVKVVGKLSDRMKALKEKGKDSPPKDKASPSSPNREKASAQKKKVEEMLQKLETSKAGKQSTGQAEVKSPPTSSEKASAQKKKVEEMLQKQLNPKAFLEAKGKTHQESAPRRASVQKQRVEEMLQRQLDPKAFLDSKEKAVHESFGQKEDFEEHKKLWKAKEGGEKGIENPPPKCKDSVSDSV